METYGEVCQRIADWISKDTNGKINFTADDVFDLDITFPALIIGTLRNYMNRGCNATDVFVSYEYCAKRVILKLNEKGQI